jgi:Mrp family chromosome partitioning ATPase
MPEGNDGVKLVISGKGGVGKTTLAAFVINEISRWGMNVPAFFPTFFLLGTGLVGLVGVKRKFAK